MAEKSDCVIVGRCGDFVLRGMRPLRLFIYADMEFKMERCRQRGEDVQGLTDEGLKKKILTVDKRRAKYYQFFTDQMWGKKEYYDLCINTTEVDISDLAKALSCFPLIRHRGRIRD